MINYEKPIIKNKIKLKFLYFPTNQWDQKEEKRKEKKGPNKEQNPRIILIKYISQWKFQDLKVLVLVYATCIQRSRKELAMQHLCISYDAFLIIHIKN